MRDLRRCLIVVFVPAWLVVSCSPSGDQPSPEAAAPARGAAGSAPLPSAPQPSDSTIAAETSTTSARSQQISPATTAEREPWRKLGQFEFAALPIAQMPPDEGYVSPIAADDEAPAGVAAQQLAKIESNLKTWPPGKVADRVQRVRNYLLLLGVADIAQSPLERFLPAIVVRRMLEDIPSGELAQLMCWVALHPEDGDVSVLTDPQLIELGAANVEADDARNRTHFYGVKLTRRLIGW